MERRVLRLLADTLQPDWECGGELWAEAGYPVLQRFGLCHLSASAV